MRGWVKGAVVGLRGTLAWPCAAFLLAVVGGGAPAAAQTPRGDIHGTVSAPDGDPVAAAEVALLRGGAAVASTGTDAAGRFRISATPGPYRLRVRAVGYRVLEREVTVGPGPTLIDVVLEVDAVPVEGVRVQGQRQRVRFEEEPGATVVEIGAQELRRLPGLAEADVLRAVEVLPGVVSTSDFSAAFNVRGGAADQNLILLDGVPIYNPFHLGGLFGVFNADMVERAELMAGGFPARYGGRVSSVLDVRSDAGDGQPSADAAVSLLATRVTAGGGLPRSAARALGFGAVNARVSARRSYFDVLLSPFFDFPYHLTDLQAAVDAWTGNGRLTLTGYSGDDVLDLAEAEDFPLRLRLRWGNDAGGVRWEGTLGGVEVGARLAASAFATRLAFPDFADAEFRSRIAEARGGVDVIIPVGRAELGLGGEAAHVGYDNLARSGGTVFGRGADDGWQTGAYGQLRWESARWILEAGARLDTWDPASSDAFVVPSPRLAVKRFLAGGDVAIKAAGGRYAQFVHSLRDEELPLGIDTWITAGARAPAVISDQVQIGVEGFRGGWHASVEGYLRDFDGVVAINAADDPDDPADDLLRGDGVSYGVDFLLRREAAQGRRVTGWAALSLLRAERSFPDPLSAAPMEMTYPPIYDRRIDLDVVLQYPLPGGIEGGLRFNYGSGLPYTRPVGSYIVHEYDLDGGRLSPVENDDEDGTTELGTAVSLGARNSRRYPAYHRLDVSFRRSYDRGWGRVTPYLDVLNVYDRRENVLFYFFEYEESPPVRTGVSMLPIIPTIGVEVSF